MPSLWMPGAVADAVTAEGDIRKEARDVLDFKARLEGVDSRLDLIPATGESEQNTKGQLKAGYYYIRRRNEDGTVALWEVADENGNACVPMDAHLEQFRSGDAHNAAVRKERARKKTLDELARDAKDRRRRDEQRGRLQEEADFAFRVQVPVTKSLKEN